MARMVSYPSISGIMMSIKTTSIPGVFFKRSIAALPFSAVNTSI